MEKLFLQNTIEVESRVISFVRKIKINILIFFSNLVFNNGLLVVEF